MQFFFFTAPNISPRPFLSATLSGVLSITKKKKIIFSFLEKLSYTNARNYIRKLKGVSDRKGLINLPGSQIPQDVLQDI